jgi:hypothetical protein
VLGSQSRGEAGSRAITANPRFYPIWAIRSRSLPVGPQDGTQEAPAAPAASRPRSCPLATFDPRPVEVQILDHDRTGLVALGNGLDF